MPSSHYSEFTPQSQKLLENAPSPSPLPHPGGEDKRSTAHEHSSSNRDDTGAASETAMGKDKRPRKESATRACAPALTACGSRACPSPNRRISCAGHRASRSAPPAPPKSG